MNNKIQRFIEPNTRFYFVIMLIFAVGVAVFRRAPRPAELGALCLLVIYALIVSRKKRRELIAYIDSITYDVQNAKTTRC